MQLERRGKEHFHSKINDMALSRHIKKPLSLAKAIRIYLQIDVSTDLRALDKTWHRFMLKTPLLADSGWFFETLLHPAHSWSV